MPKKKTEAKKFKTSKNKLAAKPAVKPPVKSPKKIKHLAEYIGGSVFIFIGLSVIGLSVNLLAVPESPGINPVPLVKGAQDQNDSAIAMAEEKCSSCAQKNETAAKSFIAESAVEQTESNNEPADTPLDNTLASDTVVSDQAAITDEIEQSPTINLDKNNCANYKFYQVNGTNNDLAESSIVMQAADTKSAKTIITRLAEAVRSEKKFLLLTNQADAINCRLIFFTEIVESPSALKSGLFSYDTQSGEFKETSLSSKFKGYVNYKFNSDFSKMIVIHDNLDLGENEKTLEVLSLPEDQAKIMVKLEGNETFNQGEGFGGFSGNFGWSADEKSIFYDVYAGNGSQATLLEQRTIAWP